MASDPYRTLIKSLKSLSGFLIEKKDQGRVAKCEKDPKTLVSVVGEGLAPPARQEECFFENSAANSYILRIRRTFHVI